MENQSYVTVSVPASLEDAEHIELANDIRKYGGIIHDAEWQEHHIDPAFDWIKTEVVIPMEWTENLKPEEADFDDSLYRWTLFRLPNGKSVVEEMTMDPNQDRSVIYD